MFLETLKTFTVTSLPDLDTVTLGALELFEATKLPEIDFSLFTRPLIVGSGNAAVVGRLLFDESDAVFADESTFLQKLSATPAIDGAVLISASGSKHAVTIARTLQERGISTILLTNNEHAPAKDIVGDSHTYVFPKNREPYTYNTSTYMGMLLSKTYEDEKEVKDFIESKVIPIIPGDLTKYGAFYLMVPDRFGLQKEMLETKFNELFGPKLMARVFTLEQTKHAKTVIERDDEVFVSFGVENELFGKPENRLFVPLPEGADYVAMMAIGYVFVGHIQKQFPPFYKERISKYCEETSVAFGTTILPVVE